MKARHLHSELVAFHFGEISEDERTRVEAHLAECSACLQEYFLFKRNTELAATSEAPSPAAKLRLRNAVMQKVQRAPVRAAFPWWTRSVALSCAAAGLLIAMKAVLVLKSSSGAQPHGMNDRPAQSSSHP